MKYTPLELSVMAKFVLETGHPHARMMIDALANIYATHPRIIVQKIEQLRI